MQFYLKYVRVFMCMGAYVHVCVCDKFVYGLLMQLSQTYCSYCYR